MTEYAENTRPRPSKGEKRTTNDEQRLHVVIGIPCLLLGGTEMQTLMVVKALLKEGFGVRCSLLRPEGYAGQAGLREEDGVRCAALTKQGGQTAEVRGADNTEDLNRRSQREQRIVFPTSLPSLPSCSNSGLLPSSSPVEGEGPNAVRPLQSCRDILV